jgi:hypothetical protein
MKKQQGITACVKGSASANTFRVNQVLSVENND